MWKRTTIILIKKEAEPRVFGFFFKAMVQAVLLLDLDTWVFTPLHGKGPGGFQDQVGQRLMEQILRQKTDSKWEYTLVEMARKEVGLQTMEEYMWRRQNTVA